MNPMNTNAQNTEHGEKLMNSPTLSLKEIAGTIMAELEKNENVKEVVVHVYNILRIPDSKISTLVQQPNNQYCL